MKTAIYPGSFNPWHKGHSDILRKALFLFDRVVIAVANNPDKEAGHDLSLLHKNQAGIDHTKIEVRHFNGLLVDFLQDLCENDWDPCAIIRGLRNGHDLQYEMNNQYWNEDLGLGLPFVYFICDRGLSHISSSSIRALREFSDV